MTLINETITYATYTNHTFAYFIMIIALLTFVFIMFERLSFKK